jgi:hypothetical protein
LLLDIGYRKGIIRTLYVAKKILGVIGASVINNQPFKIITSLL